MDGSHPLFHAVEAAAALLTNVDSPHKCSHFFIARSWSGIDDAVDWHEKNSGAGRLSSSIPNGEPAAEIPQSNPFNYPGDPKKQGVVRMRRCNSAFEGALGYRSMNDKELELMPAFNHNCGVVGCWECCTSIEIQYPRESAKM